jgi:hypothetical protein
VDGEAGGPLTPKRLWVLCFPVPINGFAIELLALANLLRLAKLLVQTIAIANFLK